MSYGATEVKRVLLVDDDPDILDALAAVLEPSYAVCVANNGQAALEVLANTPVDVIVLDWMMPVMDGGAFLKELRSQNTTLPVLLASAGRDVAQKCRDSGANDFLCKPFDVHALEEKLTALLAGPSGTPAPESSQAESV